MVSAFLCDRSPSPAVRAERRGMAPASPHAGQGVPGRVSRHCNH
ncbi:Hypothetical Protein RRSL_03529 [Ralstonia solanacearum UW551]|uniref:Uncharacterized protein n=1 Tax=Ralstonia solanacearum (strain UW551) TaxID=342110 RepID=A0AB33VGM6_RALSU|nr:Hypothetical Protein RRSL_03529 [Ralstonia solanacearum UW551]